MYCPQCEEDYPSIHTVCPACRTELEPPTKVAARQARNVLSVLAAGIAVAIPVLDLSIYWGLLVLVFGTVALVIELLGHIDD